MSSNNKNDIAWNQLFDKYFILENISEKGCYVISSKQINEYRESRLMTKFDHTKNLPEIFKENHLSILPLTRGTYMIGKFNTHHILEHSVDVETFPMDKRVDLESLDFENIYSEPAAINCALASGIFKHLLESEEIHTTVSGRMSTKDFNFIIRDSNSEKRSIEVSNSQCEIDAGFETEDCLAIIEAKNMKCDDFLIRQIYYPYRLWKNKISKKVIPIFMIFSNDKYSFFIYDFDDENDYNSIRLIKRKDYVFKTEPISSEDINLLLDNPLVKEPKIPFPQADSFERIIDLVGLLMINPMTKSDITENYDFDKRQTDYYSNAGIYLGLIEKFKDKEANEISLKVTSQAEKIFNQNHRDKNLSLANLILSHEVFRSVYKTYLKNAEPVSRDDIIKIMKKHNLYQINSESTYFRRSQTILKWTDWLIDIREDY